VIVSLYEAFPAEFVMVIIWFAPSLAVEGMCTSIVPPLVTE
jgi:hypothetical protein